MKGKLNIYYDKEGDFLEINVGKYTKGYFKNLGDGVFERIEEKTGKITGFAIFSFKKRIEKQKNISLELPIKNSTLKIKQQKAQNSLINN